MYQQKKIRKPFTPIQLEFEQLLRQHYSTYATWMTITHKHKTSVERARQMLKEFFTHLNDRENTFFKSHVRLFVCYDKFMSHDGIHTHVLADRLDTSKLAQIEKKCWAFFGNTVVKSTHEDVIPYLVSKYDTGKLEHFENLTINIRKKRGLSLNTTTKEKDCYAK